MVDNFDCVCQEYTEFIKSITNNDYTERVIKVLPLLHAIMGMATEVGELMDLMKKYLINNKPLDEKKLKDECGDVFFYLMNAINISNSTLREVIDLNEAKLKTRFPEGYSHERRKNRNREAEEAAQDKVVKKAQKKNRWKGYFGSVGYSNGPGDNIYVYG